MAVTGSTWLVPGLRGSYGAFIAIFQKAPRGTLKSRTSLSHTPFCENFPAWLLRESFTGRSLAAAISPRYIHIVIFCKSKSSHKSFVASPSQVTSHLLQVQVKSQFMCCKSQFKSQVICCKSNSSHKSLGHRASQVKAQVTWPKLKSKSSRKSFQLRSSHKSSQVKSSQVKSSQVTSICINIPSI